MAKHIRLYATFVFMILMTMKMNAEELEEEIESQINIQYEEVSSEDELIKYFEKLRAEVGFYDGKKTP